VKLAMVDNETGQRVKAQDLQPQAGPGADELIHLAFDAFPEIACQESGLREKQAAAFADEMTTII